MSEETRTYHMTVPQGGAFGFHLEYVGINLDTYTASFRVGRTSDDLYESDGLKLLDLRGSTADLATGLPASGFVAFASTADIWLYREQCDRRTRWYCSECQPRGKHCLRHYNRRDSSYRRFGHHVECSSW